MMYGHSDVVNIQVIIKVMGGGDHFVSVLITAYFCVTKRSEHKHTFCFDL